MSWIVLHQSALATLATDEARVRAADVAPLADTLALLARAEVIAAAAAARVEAARATGYDDGFAQGLAAGRADADAELAAAIGDHVQTTQLAIAALRADTTRLALEVVAHIAGALATETVLTGLAQTALDRFGPGRVTVRVAPTLAPALAHQLQPHPEVRVLADPTLGRLDIILETPQGKALAGLDAQLARVAHAWEVADAA